MRPIFLIIPLLLIPSVSAQSLFTVNVDNQEHNDLSRTNQAGTAVYSFNLRNPPFDLNQTFGDFNNSSVSTAYIKASFDDSLPIDTQRTYAITVQYNDNHHVRTAFTYEKRGFSIFTYFNAYYSRQVDGVETCHYTDRLSFVNNPRPNPYIIFDFSIHGSYNSVTPTGLTIGEDEVSGEVYYNSAALSYHFGDSLLDYSAANVGGTNSVFQSTPCGSGLGEFIPDVIEINTAPILTMEQYDSIPKDHYISYRFLNRSVELSEIAQEINDINDSRCKGVFFFIICIDPVAIFQNLFHLITRPVEMLLDIIPGGPFIKQIILVPVQFVADIFILLGSIFFANGEGVPIGGVFWSLLMWNVALGLGVTAFTGNLRHIVGVPYWFAYGIIYTSIRLFYFIFIYLPTLILGWFFGLVGRVV